MILLIILKGKQSPEIYEHEMMHYFMERVLSFDDYNNIINFYKSHYPDTPIKTIVEIAVNDFVSVFRYMTFKEMETKIREMTAIEKAIAKTKNAVNNIFRNENKNLYNYLKEKAIYPGRLDIQPNVITELQNLLTKNREKSNQEFDNFFSFISGHTFLRDIDLKPVETQVDDFINHLKRKTNHLKRKTRNVVSVSKMREDIGDLPTMFEGIRETFGVDDMYVQELTEEQLQEVQRVIEYISSQELLSNLPNIRLNEISDELKKIGTKINFREYSGIQKLKTIRTNNIVRTVKGGKKVVDIQKLIDVFTGKIKNSGISIEESFILNEFIKERNYINNDVELDTFISDFNEFFTNKIANFIAVNMDRTVGHTVHGGVYGHNMSAVFKNSYLTSPSYDYTKVGLFRDFDVPRDRTHVFHPKAGDFNNPVSPELWYNEVTVGGERYIIEIQSQIYADLEETVRRINRGDVDFNTMMQTPYGKFMLEVIQRLTQANPFTLVDLTNADIYRAITRDLKNAIIDITDKKESLKKINSILKGIESKFVDIPENMMSAWKENNFKSLHNNKEIDKLKVKFTKGFLDYLRENDINIRIPKDNIESRILDESFQEKRRNGIREFNKIIENYFDDMISMYNDDDIIKILAHTKKLLIKSVENDDWKYMNHNVVSLRQYISQRLYGFRTTQKNSERKYAKLWHQTYYAGMSGKKAGKLVAKIFRETFDIANEVALDLKGPHDIVDEGEKKIIEKKIPSKYLNMRNKMFTIAISTAISRAKQEGYTKIYLNNFSSSQAVQGEYSTANVLYATKAEVEAGVTQKVGVVDFKKLKKQFPGLVIKERVPTNKTNDADITWTELDFSAVANPEPFYFTTREALEEIKDDSEKFEDADYDLPNFVSSNDLGAFGQYTSEYIRRIKSSPIVKEAIRRYGFNQLINKIGIKVMLQDGKPLNEFAIPKDFDLGKAMDDEILQIITDGFISVTDIRKKFRFVKNEFNVPEVPTKDVMDIKPEYKGKIIWAQPGLGKSFAAHQSSNVISSDKINSMLLNRKPGESILDAINRNFGGVRSAGYANHLKNLRAILIEYAMKGYTVVTPTVELMDIADIAFSIDPSDDNIQRIMNAVNSEGINDYKRENRFKIRDKDAALKMYQRYKDNMTKYSLPFKNFKTDEWVSNVIFEQKTAEENPTTEKRLTEEQEKAAIKIHSWLDDSKKYVTDFTGDLSEEDIINNLFFLLAGAGGTGKTYSTEMIVNQKFSGKERKRFVYAAPTHKAKTVLADNISSGTAITVQSLLGLMKDVTPTSRFGKESFAVPVAGDIPVVQDNFASYLSEFMRAPFIIIDEASQLSFGNMPEPTTVSFKDSRGRTFQVRGYKNPPLGRYLVELIKYKYRQTGILTRVFFMGDVVQTVPVGEASFAVSGLLEKLFANGRFSQLETVMRVNDVDIHTLNTQLRSLFFDVYKLPVSERKNAIDISDLIRITNNAPYNGKTLIKLSSHTEMVNKFIEYYHQNMLSDKPNPNLSVIINYNSVDNKNTQESVKYIRNKLFGNEAQNKLVNNELLTMGGEFKAIVGTDKNQYLELSKDENVIIRDLRHEPDFEFEVTITDVRSETVYIDAIVVTLYQTTANGEVIEYKDVPIPTDRTMQQINLFWNMNTRAESDFSMHTPQVVYKLKEQLFKWKYGYIVNNFKIQGSGIDFPMIDAKNIIFGTSKDDAFHKLTFLYTGVSRVKKKLYIYNGQALMKQQGDNNLEESLGSVIDAITDESNDGAIIELINNSITKEEEELLKKSCKK